MNKHLLVFALLVTVFAESTVEVDQTVKIELKANVPTVYSVTIPKPDGSGKLEDLFILADPIVSSPSQVPVIEVILSNGTVSHCLTDDNQLEGICRLSTSLLGSNITLSLSCQEDCAFWLRLYINDVYTLDLDRSYTLTQKNEQMTIYEFDLQVPSKSFDELCIYLIFQRVADAGNGAEMYANVGNWGALQPDQQNYQYRAEPLLSGIILDFPKEDVPVGTWIKISLFSQFKGQMRLSTFLSTGDSYTLPLNDPTYAVIPHGKTNIFNISLASDASSLDKLDVNIEILLYSGYPQISASFLPDFSHTLQNYGAGGNLNYLITPQIRSSFNFSGTIYLRIQAFDHEVSFGVTARIVSSQFVSMREGFSYLSVSQSKNTKNYIYDYRYLQPKVAGGNQTLQFTVKVEMIKGGVMFYSRICEENNSQECLVSLEDLKNSTFIKQTEAVRGEVLHYYSVYEIFQWIQLSQCKKEEYNQTYYSYLCRLQIVLQTFDQESQWIITIFSRQSNIQLREGQSFKDKVFESSYNYYYFIPPQGQYEEITIFMTTMTGETDLLASQIIKRPQFIFAKLDNTMKITSKHSITYKKSQIRGKIYIGVFGESMAEYVIHVIVNKNGSRSIVNLIPQLGQLFRLGASQVEMKFRIKPNFKGEWLVQVTPINDKVSFQVVPFSTNSTVALCSSQKDQTCLISASGEDSYQLTVSRSSSSSKDQIKFVAAYFPKDQCRILPLGTPNLMTLPATSTSCVQYILDGREVVFAYSRNILSALTSNIMIEMSINGQVLKKLEGHYRTIDAATIKDICFGSNEKAERCILKVKIKGDDQTSIDLWLTTTLTEASIPLFTGVLLPFSRNNVGLSAPLHFYYEQTDPSTMTVMIQSLTYASYDLEWAWIDQSDYLQANNDSEIYPKLGEGQGSTHHITRWHRTVSIQIKSGDKCKNCILLISILPKQDTKSNQFQIQIVGSSVPIGLGQTKKGTLNDEEAVMFIVSSHMKDSVLEFNGYARSPCYNITAFDRRNEEYHMRVTSELVVKADQSIEIELVGKEDGCSYEVSLWESDVPIRNMMGGHTYSVKLDANQSSLYFVYHHTLNASFWVYEVITSGALSSYATPLLQKSLEEVIKNQQFEFGSASPYEDLYVETTNPYFCFDCYYLIKLVGKPTTEVKVGISDVYTPVVMFQGGVVRQKIKAQSTRMFDYYTADPFTVRMTIVRGSLLVNIEDDSKKGLFSKILSKDEVISIKNVDHLFTDYKITLQSQQATVYAMQIVGQEGVRLIDGLPYSVTVKENTPKQFLYSHGVDSNIYIAVMVQNRNETEMPSIKLVVAMLKQEEQGKTIPVIPEFINGNMALFSFIGMKADYKLSFTVSVETDIKVLITRNQLTYLPAGIELTTFKPSIFEINTKGHPVMLEAFACKGPIQLFATDQYSYFQQTNTAIDLDKSPLQLDKSPVVVLQHNNIAGHYVVNSQSSSPEFYAQLSGEMYRITYSYITDQIPFKYFTAVNTNLNYDLSTDIIALQLQLPIPRINMMKMKMNGIKAQLELVYGRNYDDVKTYSQCRSGGQVISIKTDIDLYPPETEDFQVQINRKQIQSIFSQELEQMFIACQIFITYSQPDKTMRTLEYIYDPMRVDFKDVLIKKDETGYSWLTDIMILVFVALIVAVVLYVASRFCWRYWKMYRQHEGYRVHEEQNSSVNALSNVRDEVTEKN